MNYSITKIDNGYLLSTMVNYYGTQYNSSLTQKYFATIDEVFNAIKNLEQGGQFTVTFTNGETTGYIGENNG
jgi:hypothetical protein